MKINKAYISHTIRFGNLNRFLFLCFFVFLCGLSSFAGINIQVVDSVTKENLPYVTINIKGGAERTIYTDKGGKASLEVPLNESSSIEISYLGYSPKILRPPFDEKDIQVRLVPIGIDLTDVTIKPKKEKYSKKNNPAVDFVTAIRKSGDKHNPFNEDFYSYDKYEKTLVALNDFQGNFESGLFGKKMDFLKNYVDTSNWTGKRLLDLILKEKVSSRIHSKQPRADKDITIAYRSAGIDESLDQNNMKIILEDMVRETDIYNSDIYILQNKFVSPLSGIGPDFYKYYLTDTVFIGNEKCVELTFVPRNDKTFGFNGKIYVPLGDTTMFVKKITMRAPHDINLNYVKNLFINQSFEKDSLGNRHKTYDDVCIELQIVAGTPEIYARKTSIYDNFSYEPREELKEYYSKTGHEFSLTDSIGRTEEFWNIRRMVPLTGAESRMIYFSAEMRKVPFFYWTEKVVRLLAKGYITTGNPSKFDIGPLNTFLSFNSVEGVRLRAGGMTMASLSPHFFAKGYVAYGTKDEKWKYMGEVEYSFSKKENHGYEWPRHGIYASYSYDLDMIGQHYLFTNPDNIFLSLKRKKSDLVTYRHLAKAGYVLELRNHFSVEAGFSFQIQESTKWLPFVFQNGNIDKNYRQSAFNVSLRWAPGEKFVQGRSTRLPVNLDAWIFQLTHEFGPKGIFGSAFTMNRTEISIQKRLWLSAFGYMDIILKGGKVWSSVYYPALMWPNANLSYTIQPESYSLMSPMEFANDAYAAIDFSYFGNGILFNRLPLINKLKLREVVTFKGLAGTLSDKNNPAYNQNLYLFPADSHAMKMKSTPYMEIGVGIDNIISFLRVDYVWRLTYRDTPGVDKSGLRVSLHFTF